MCSVATYHWPVHLSLNYDNTIGYICLITSLYLIRVHKIAYGFVVLVKKKCQSLIFYCKIPILCQSLANFAQILLVMSDRTDEFHELWFYSKRYTWNYLMAESFGKVQDCHRKLNVVNSDPFHQCILLYLEYS
jgi:hypothetical protein